MKWQVHFVLYGVNFSSTAQSEQVAHETIAKLNEKGITTAWADEAPAEEDKTMVQRVVAYLLNAYDSCSRESRHEIPEPVIGWAREIIKRDSQRSGQTFDFKTNVLEPAAQLMGLTKPRQGK